MKAYLIEDLMLLSKHPKRSLDYMYCFKAKPESPIYELLNERHLREGAQMAEQAFARYQDRGIFQVYKSHPSANVQAVVLGFLNDEAMGNCLWHEVLIESAQEKYLCLKVNHTLSDGVGTRLWLQAQLSHKVTGNSSLAFRGDLPEKKGQSSFTPWRPSPSFPGQDGEISEKRDFLYFKLPKTSSEKFTDNDCLVAACLRALSKIKRASGNYSAWLPVNLRSAFYEGYGNALGRARIYDTDADSGPEELAASVHRQKKSAWNNGELFQLRQTYEKTAWKSFLLKAYIHRPWVDMGTVPISHLTEPENGHPLWRQWDEIVCVMNLHKKHPVGVYIHTASEHHVTLTFDPGLIDGDLMRQYQNFICEIYNEF